MLGSHRDMHTYPDSGSDSHRWMWSGTSSQRLMYKAQLQGRFHLWSQVQSICLHCCHHPWWRTDSDQENMQEIVRFVKLWIKINSHKLIFIIGLSPPMKTNAWIALKRFLSNMSVHGVYNDDIGASWLSIHVHVSLYMRSGYILVMYWFLQRNLIFFDNISPLQPRPCIYMYSSL